MIPVSAFLMSKSAAWISFRRMFSTSSPDVAGLGQRRRVGDRERHVEDPRERLREQRLAAAGRAEQEDVRLLELDLVVLRPI
jgi:hypothetical protein